MNISGEGVGHADHSPLLTSWELHFPLSMISLAASETQWGTTGNQFCFQELPMTHINTWNQFPHFPLWPQLQISNLAYKLFL